MDTLRNLRRSSAIGWALFLVLAWAGAYICREAFFTESRGHFASMHGEWMAMARITGLDWLRPRWWPYWGAGAPYPFAYAPLIPFLIAVIARVFHCTPALALHAVSGFVYCLGPVALYLAAWRLSKSPGWAFLAGACYLLASPAELLEAKGAFGLAWFATVRRSYRLFEWDDLPHQTALALLPLAVWLLARALEKRRTRDYALAGSVMAAMMLASMFGVVLAALTAATVPLAMAGRLRTAGLARSAMVALGAYLVVSPWVPPSLLRTISADAALDGESDWTTKGIVAASLLALSLVVAWRTGKRFAWNWPVRWAALFAAFAIVIPALDHFGGLHFAPQPQRYVVEMEVALALAVACAAAGAARFLPKWALAVVAFGLLVLAGKELVSHRRFVKRLLQPAEVAKSIEYRSAKWLEANLPGQRVLVPGSMAAWLNAFTNVPQFCGQSYSTAPNWMQQVAQYTVFSGDGLGTRDAEYAILWLKAFGVSAVGVSGPRSPEYWKPYARPGKFEGVLPVLWREDDTTIYAVPRPSPSLAHAMLPEEVVRRKPIHGADVDELRRYVAALDSEPLPLAFEWRGSEEARIRGKLAPAQVVSVQVTFDKGWQATVNGAQRPVERDGIGLMTVRPSCEGDCEIQLTYNGGWEARLCYAASAAVLLALAGAAVWRRRKIP